MLGSTYWGVQDLGSAGNFYAYANNYTSGEGRRDLAHFPGDGTCGTPSPALSFQNACNFTGPALEVFVSTGSPDGQRARHGDVDGPRTGPFTGNLHLDEFRPHRHLGLLLLELPCRLADVGTDTEGRAWRWITSK